MDWSMFGGAWIRLVDLEAEVRRGVIWILLIVLMQLTRSGLMVVFFTQVENTEREADSLSWGRGRMRESQIMLHHSRSEIPKASKRDGK